jgi:hypothetical protein
LLSLASNGLSEILSSDRITVTIDNVAGPNTGYAPRTVVDGTGLSGSVWGVDMYHTREHSDDNPTAGGAYNLVEYITFNFIFDREYELGRTWIWNGMGGYNVNESAGLRQIDVYYLDPDDSWQLFVSNFMLSNPWNDYHVEGDNVSLGEAGPDFEQVVARGVKFKVAGPWTVGNWGQENHAQLAEVQFEVSEPGPTVEFEIADSQALESVGRARIMVALNFPVEEETYTVDYNVIGGTATNGVDYVIGSGGPVCWNYPTQCHGDCDNDANVKGSDFLALKNSWYACDPDENYDFCADFDRNGCVKGSDFLILKANWYQTVEANCPASGDNTLVFSPGETSKTIEIDIVDDGLDEEDETIILELSNPTGPDVQLGNIYQHTYTIIDPRPKISFVAESGSGTEGATPALVAVSLSHACDEVVTVDYAVSGGSATGGGVDYTLPPDTLTFAPAETIKNISIDIVDDDEQESTETIEISLSNPTNATLGQPAVHTYAIVDNEQGVVFDGMVWYFTGDNTEGRFEVNAEGQLEWRNLYPPDHIFVPRPPQRFSDPGDVVEVSYWYKGEGGSDLVSGDRGTGDIRIGLFDSNGSCIPAPPTWYVDDCWGLYLGYRIGFSAHASGYGGHISKRKYPAPDEVSLVQAAEGPYGDNSSQKDINAFELARGQWALLTLRLERFSSSEVVFTVSCNGRVAVLTDSDPQNQPQKIDAMAMYFANVRSYTLVSFATEQPTP